MKWSFFTAILFVMLGLLSDSALSLNEDKVFEEPKSPIIEKIYDGILDTHRSDEMLDELNSKYPGEVKSELMRIICLESNYFKADEIGSIALQCGAGAAARLYGHDGNVYGQLKKLIQVSEAALEKKTDGSGADLEAEIDKMKNGVIHGLAVGNKNESALSNLVDLTRSGLLGPKMSPRGLVDSFSYIGSRAAAYDLLARRCEMEADSEIRQRILEMLGQCLSAEEDPRLKNRIDDSMRRRNLVINSRVRRDSNERDDKGRANKIAPQQGISHQNEGLEGAAKSPSKVSMMIWSAMGGGLSVLIVLIVWKYIKRGRAN